MDSIHIITMARCLAIFISVVTTKYNQGLYKYLHKICFFFNFDAFVTLLLGIPIKNV